jgi:hypothetical protein
MTETASRPGPLDPSSKRRSASGAQPIERNPFRDERVRASVSGLLDRPGPSIHSQHLGSSTVLEFQQIEVSVKARPRDEVSAVANFPTPLVGRVPDPNRWLGILPVETLISAHHVSDLAAVGTPDKVADKWDGLCDLHARSSQHSQAAPLANEFPVAQFDRGILSGNVDFEDLLKNRSELP